MSSIICAAAAAVSYCYKKIFNVKSNENIHLFMDKLNSDDVDTLLAWQSESRSLLVVLHEWTVYCVN